MLIFERVFQLQARFETPNLARRIELLQNPLDLWIYLLYPSGEEPSVYRVQRIRTNQICC